MKKKLLDVKALPVQFREASIRAMDPAADAPDDAPVTYEVAVSSECEVMRWFGVEILDHGKGAVDMSRLKRGAAVMVDHYGDQVGVVDSASVDADRVLRAVIRFSKSDRGQEIERDVRDGIRQNVSVGYQVIRAKKTETRESGVEVWRVTRWQPAEVSIVSVPADITVGVGRSEEGRDVPVEVEDGTAVKEDEMKRVRDASGAVIEVADDDARPAVVTPSVDQIREAENKRQADIVGLCEANGLSARAPEYVGSTLSVEQVAARVAAFRATKGGTQPAAESLKDLGVPEKDLRAYSYARAILCGALVREGVKFDGLEAEVHQELEAKRPSSAQTRGGVLVPLALGTGKRNLNAASAAGKGAELVFEQAGDLIELLRNRAAVIALGARTLTGLTAPIAFPKQSAAMTAYWVGENAATGVTTSDMTLALALLTPKTLQGTTAYSRQLLAQASIDVEAMVRDELAKIHAIAIDFAAIHGLGAAGEPTGIYKALNVGATAVGGAMTYAKILDMEGKVATANAMFGSLGWLMNPTMSANLKAVYKVANTFSPVWEGPITEGTVDGFKAIASAQVSKVATGSERTGGSEIASVFGNWNDVIIGSFGALEILSNPFSSATKGLIEVTSFQMADVLIRHGESFAKSTGATA